MNQNDLRKTALLAARNSGPAFGKLIYSPYQTPPHILKIWKYLEKLERGEIKRLIITAPPRHGKSQTVTKIFPAWLLGRNPQIEVMIGSYAQSLASTFGRDIRNFMSSDIYKEIFPSAILSKDSKAKAEFATISGGQLHAAGIDGSFTGKGAEVFILDDTIKNAKQARSETHKKSLRDFYDEVAETRLTPTGKVVAMHTRWAEDDLIGYLLSEKKEEGWTVLNMPAISKDDVPLWPEKFSLELLKKLQAAKPKVFEALYQQNPSIEGGHIVKTEWWQTWYERPARFDKIIQSWDLSFDDDGADNAYTVGAVWGKIGNKCYLLDLIRRKAGFTDQLRMFAELTRREPRAYKKLIEKKANGAALIKVVENKISGIEAIEPHGDKTMRLESVSPFIENGQVFLPDPKTHPWVLEFIKEHATFPNGKYADQVDTTSQALFYLLGEYKTDMDQLIKMYS